jgi:hypothetical protein
MDVPDQGVKMQKPKVRKLPQGRTILEQAGAPVLVQMVTREATTAPEGTRVKATLVALVQTDEETAVLPLPFAQTGGRFTPEFRLEMN